MTHLYVKIEKHCVHSYREDREWGSWEESYRNSLEGVSLDKDHYYWANSCPVDFEVKKGDVVYVIWAEYSSGDSFGRGERNSTDVVHVFMNKDLAREAYQSLLNTPVKEHDKDWYDSWNAKFMSDSGEEIIYHRPWLGYFDSLDEIHVEEAIVK